MFNNFLDNDLYKFTMQQAVFKLFPYAEASYKFICRDKDVKFSKNVSEDLIKGYVRFKNACTELDIQDIANKFGGLFSPLYLEYLCRFQHDKITGDDIIWDKCSVDLNGSLEFEFSGKWVDSIFYEVVFMSMISEMYHNNLSKENDVIKQVEDRTVKKAEFLHSIGAQFMEFGTRRRYSAEVQDKVVSILKNYNNFLGTSNLYLACKYKLKAIGTVAHEWIMAHAALYGYINANQRALDSWMHAYVGNNIALTDTYTSDIFFKTFTSYYMDKIDVIRQDSGDPLDFIDKTLNHYRTHEIDSRNKTIIFSDNLNVDMVKKIQDYCGDSIKCVFEIGTNLTCDIEGVKPLNIVIKMNKWRLNSKCKWINTVKLSDVSGKYTGNEEDIIKCKKELECI